MRARRDSWAPSRDVCDASPSYSRECSCTRSITGLPVRFRGVPLRRPLDTLADRSDDEFQLGFVTGLYTMISLPQSPYWCGSAHPRSQSSAARFDGRQRWMLVSSIPCRCAGAIGFRCGASDVSGARRCAAPVAPQRGRRPLGELRMRPLRGCHGTRAAAKRGAWREDSSTDNLSDSPRKPADA